MKTYIANKPYVIVVKDNKVIHQSKIRIGGAVQTDGSVEWFTKESDFKARLSALNYTPKSVPKAPSA